MGKMPAWLEALVIKGMKEFIPASLIADAFDKFKAEIIAKAKELAADTSNTIDDMVVSKLEQILNGCAPDVQFLCDLIEKGEDSVIIFLRDAVAKTENKIDDAAIEILAKALKD